MKIYTPDNKLFLEPHLSDGYRQKSIMGDNTLTLQYSLDYYIEVPQRAWCTFKNEIYFLMSAQQPTKINDSHFDYKLIFDSDISKTKTQVFEFIELVYESDGSIIITNSPTPEFSLTGRPQDHLAMLVNCMNYKDPTRGWEVGEFVDSDEITIDYSHNFCFDVLRILADKFNTEWEVEGKTIHLRKVEKMKDSAIPLSYGYNKGLLSGISRTTYKEPIGRLVIKTSDRNIDQAKYGSRTLKMPRNISSNYKGVEYITDATGTKLQRKNPLMGDILPEASLDIIKIYPRRVGIVTEVITVDDSKGQYDFRDDSIPEDLNFKDTIIPNEKMIIIFQSGQLSGVGGDNGFEVNYNHSERRFMLVPINDNGLIYPQGRLIPTVGDKYAVFHINLPEKYITDAENELLNEALKYFVENEQPRYTYKATLDEFYAKRKWEEIGGFLNLGYFVRISEPEFIPEPVDIRIVSIKEYIDKEKQPIIEMSNSITGRSSFASNNNSAQTQSQTNNRIESNAIEFAKRRFRDAEETMQMLQESLLHFSGAINPITVQTMLLLVGDKNLQFQFVDNKLKPVHIPHKVTYDREAKRLHIGGGILQHMTLDIDSISSSHKPEDYRFWDMAEYISPVLIETKAKYFVYAKVERLGSVGTFLITESAIEMESDPIYYHLLVGTLNSEFENSRSFVELYGFTEIAPGRITTDRIVSSDGFNFFDFVKNTFRLTNNKIGSEEQALNWEDGTLTMTNATINKSLKVLGEALVAGFIFSNTLIKANKQTNIGGTGNPIEVPSLLIDGVNGLIRLYSSYAGGEWSQNPTLGSTISLTSSSGTVETRSNVNNRVAYMSPSGIFCNSAETQAVSATLGVIHKASIVGLGYGNVNKNDWQNENFIAGVYGRAENSGTAPAYGGFFYNLMASGLFLRMKASTESSGDVYVSESTSLVIGYSRYQSNVYLPADGVIGRTVFLKQWWTGHMRVYPQGGQKLYDDSTPNDYIDIAEGWGAICHFTVGYIGENSVKTEAWLISKFKF